MKKVLKFDEYWDYDPETKKYYNHYTGKWVGSLKKPTASWITKAEEYKINKKII